MKTPWIWIVLKMLDFPSYDYDKKDKTTDKINIASTQEEEAQALANLFG